MSVYGLQMGKEMLEQTPREEAGADQKPGSTDTNGKPKPGGSDGHATDPSTSTCSASTNNHPPEPVQDCVGRHRRTQL